MKNEPDDNNAKNDNRDEFDYEDLINNFSIEDESETEDSAQAMKNLDSIALSELLGDEVEDKSDSDGSSGNRFKVEEEEFAEIFNELDETARGSIFEDESEVDTTEQSEGKPEKKVSDFSFDETGIFLDERIDTEEGDYASILNQIEGSGDTETGEESPSDDLTSTVEEPDSIELPDTEKEEITGGIVPVEDEYIQADVTAGESETTAEFLMPENEEPRAEDAEDTEITGEFAVQAGEDLQTGYGYGEGNITDELAVQVDDETLASSETGNLYEEVLEGYGSDDIKITGESSIAGEESQVEVVEEPEFAESDFSGGDLFGGDETEEEKPHESTVSAVEESKEEDDFLGLGSLTGGGASSGAAESRFGGTTEVLFEGVEMDFDDQISSVTLAEVLIAQGKKQEATELYMKVASQKGTTHWVSERLNQLNPQEGNET